VIDLSGRQVQINLNPANGGTCYNPDAKTVTIVDDAGNVATLHVASISEPDNIVILCIGRQCER
jgi:hypothetical protein